MLMGQAFGESKTYILDTNSGATMQFGSHSGVSLIGVINAVDDNLAGRFAVQLLPVTFGGTATGAAGNLTNYGYGTTTDAGASIYLCYGKSNTALTTTQWQAKGTSGTTDITYWAVGSGSSIEPYRFYPEMGQYTAIFARSGCSQLLVPKATLFAN